MSNISSKYYNDERGLLRCKEADAIFDFVDEITKQIADEQEKLLENLLGKCGFTREFVLSHRGDFWVDTFAEDPKRRVYMYKNIALFMIIDEDPELDDSDGTYTYYKTYKYAMLWDGTCACIEED